MSSVEEGSRGYLKSSFQYQKIPQNPEQQELLTPHHTATRRQLTVVASPHSLRSPPFTLNLDHRPESLRECSGPDASVETLLCSRDIGFPGTMLSSCERGGKVQVGSLTRAHISEHSAWLHGDTEAYVTLHSLHLKARTLFF